MLLLESLQDGLDRILPRRKKDAVVSKSNIGIVRYQDDVRFSPALLRSILFLLLPRCSLVARSSQSVLISTSFPTLFT